MNMGDIRLMLQELCSISTPDALSNSDDPQYEESLSLSAQTNADIPLMSGIIDEAGAKD
jgi:hypothetical protein